MMFHCGSVLNVTKVDELYYKLQRARGTKNACAVAACSIDAAPCQVIEKESDLCILIYSPNHISHSRWQQLTLSWLIYLHLVGARRLSRVDIRLENWVGHKKYFVSALEIFLIINWKWGHDGVLFKSTSNKKVADLIARPGTFLLHVLLVS